MAQRTVTRAFEAWNAGKILDGLPAVPDKVVFALVPDQDETVPVRRDEGMPIATHIKHTADITQAGVLNDNAVVYSVVLDTTVGDWEYNWLGLVDSKTDTVLMIVHVRTQQKLKTHNGQQGNSLTRNLSMQFYGAAEATQINVSAQTWQIDFSARLFGMDEALRLAMLDYYGVAAFLNDGFKVTLAGAQASVAPGVGYVGGLRVQRDEAEKVTVTANTSLWLDVSRQGTVTGAWASHVNVKAASTLKNYTDAAGFPHYVTPLATIKNGQLTDVRPLSPIMALDERFYTKKETDSRLDKKVDTTKVQMSQDDTTEGALIINGGHGLGANARSRGAGATGGAAGCGFFSYSAGNADNPFRGIGASGLHVQESTTRGWDLLGRNGRGLGFRLRQISDGVASEWAKLWTSANLANPATLDKAQTVTAIKTHAAAVVTTNAVAFRGTLTNGQVRNLAHINSENRVHLGDGEVPTTIHGSMMPLIQIGAGASYPILASGLNAITDTNGLWKTPGSPSLTPAAIGALSASDLAGIPLPFPGAAAPVGWLKCNGQAFDKTLYPVLAARYPNGNLPDLRGEFIRGWDGGRKVDKGRALLSTQDDAMQPITAKWAMDDMMVGSNYPPAGALYIDTTATVNYDAMSTGHGVGARAVFDASRVTRTAEETRPRNIAFNYIVRAA